MKTYAQIAEEIGVSKQAVYKRVKGKLHTYVHTYIHTEGRTEYVSEQGVALIIQDFLNNDVSIRTHTERIRNAPMDTIGVCDTDTPIYDDFINNLKEQLAIEQARNDELTKTNTRLTDEILEQSKKITELLEQSQKLTSNAQHLHATETMKLEPPIQEQKQGLLKRLFSRKSSNPF